MGGGGGREVGGGGCYAMLQIVAKQVQVPFRTNPNLMPYRWKPILFHRVMAAATRVLPSLRSVINALVPTQDGRSVSPDQMDAFILTVELAYREVLLIEHTEGLNANEESAKQYIRMALNVLREAMDTAGRVLCASRPQVETSGTAGRPRFFVPREHLEYLVENRFTVPQIAELIGVSPRTVHRRLAEFGISISSQYAEVTDEYLELVMSSIQKEYPWCGNRQMCGHLLYWLGVSESNNIASAKFRGRLIQMDR